MKKHQNLDIITFYDAYPVINEHGALGGKIGSFFNKKIALKAVENRGFWSGDGEVLEKSAILIDGYWREIKNEALDINFSSDPEELELQRIKNKLSPEELAFLEKKLRK